MLRKSAITHLRNYACVLDKYLEKFEALRNAVQGLRILRIFSTFLKILNFLKLRFKGCLAAYLVCLLLGSALGYILVPVTQFRRRTLLCSGYARGSTSS